MRLLTYLDQHQMRLGYLNCLVLVAGRQLDTRSGLLRRFEDFIFREIEAHPREFEEHTMRTDQGRGRNRGLRPGDEAGQLLRLSAGQAEQTRSRCSLHLAWLKRHEVGDPTGAVAKDRCKEILKMARSMDIIGQAHALTELGVLLRGLLLDIDRGFPTGRLDLNPFHLWRRAGLALAHLYILLRADIVLPFLVDIYARPATSSRLTVSKVGGAVRTRQRASVFMGQFRRDFPGQEANYLIKALDRLIEVIGTDLPIDETLVLKEARSLRERLGSEKSLEHHFRPRRQYLLDLGFLERTKDPTPSEQAFIGNLATQRATRALRELRSHPLKQDSLIERNFFRWSAEIYGLNPRPAESDLKRLDYFARGFPLVSREIGFTPGRTVALAGCLLAIEEGVIIEVDEMFRMMSEMAKGPYRQYLHYSGGSRLDREFLIRVDVDPLRERLRQKGVRPKGAGIQRV